MTIVKEVIPDEVVREEYLSDDIDQVERVTEEYSDGVAIVLAPGLSEVLGQSAKTATPTLFTQLEPGQSSDQILHLPVLQSFVH